MTAQVRRLSGLIYLMGLGLLGINISLFFVFDSLKKQLSVADMSLEKITDVHARYEMYTTLFKSPEKLQVSNKQTPIYITVPKNKQMDASAKLLTEPVGSNGN